MTVQTKCQNCGRPVEIEPDALRVGLPLYSAPTSVVCGPVCEAAVKVTCQLIFNGWMLTPWMLRQEARA